MGIVSHISSTANKEMFLTKFELPSGLNTTYGENISYNSYLIGRAEIITEDMSLIKRIFYKLYNVFKKN